MTLPDALDAFTDSVGTALTLPATRDPDHVIPPCVFVGPPAVRARTLGAWVLEVPVSLVATGAGDLIADDYLLTHIGDFLDAVGAREADPRPFEHDTLKYPAMQATVTLTIRSTP